MNPKHCRQMTRGAKSFVAYCRCTLFVLNEIFHAVDRDVNDDLCTSQAKHRGWAGTLLRAYSSSSLIEQTACWVSIHNEQYNAYGQG